MIIFNTDNKMENLKIKLSNYNNKLKAKNYNFSKY